MLPGRASVTPEYQRDWPAYFAVVAGKPPRDTLIRALDLFATDTNAPAAALAIDIACGEGRDTRAILARTHPRWRIIAADNHPDAIRQTLTNLDPFEAGRVAVCALSMEDLPKSPQLPPRADLINASFALPFCEPRAFPALWSWITTTLPRGGRFAGQLFGDRDEWAPIRPASHHTRQAVLDLLKPFEIEHLEEVEKDGDDAMGGQKHHHVFHIVARRR